MYIPFASLLGFGAVLEPLVLEQPAPETCSLSTATGTPYVNPTTGGGSLLDHDSGSGLGEPLNVSLFSFPLFSILCLADQCPLPHDELSLLALELVD